MKTMDSRRLQGLRLLTVVAIATLAGTACSEGDTATPRPGPGAGAAALQRSDGSDLSGTLWVTNRAHNDITAFDGRTGAALLTIPVGANPIDIVAPRNTRKVYVSNEESNTVSVISKDSLSRLGDVPMPTRNGRPHHLVQSPDGRFVYVAEYGSHRVAVIDTVTDTVVREYEVGANGAKTHAVGVSPDGRTLYAVNSGANEITALDSSTGERQWNLDVGQNPSEILVTPAGLIGYVSVRGENSVKVLDLQAGAVVEEVRVGPEPDTMQLTNDGRTLVVALRGTPAYVALVDTNDYTGVRWTQLDGTTTGHQWLSTDGAQTFVALEGARAGIGVIDNQTGQTVASYSYPVPNATTPARMVSSTTPSSSRPRPADPPAALEEERRHPSHLVGPRNPDGFQALPAPAAPAQPAPALSFGTPPPASISGNVAAFEVAANGVSIVPANGDTSGATGHFHVFVDRPVPAPGEVIPREPGIIHTTDSRVTLPGLTTGRHRIAVVLGDGVHRRIGSHVVEADVMVHGPSVVVSAPPTVAAGEPVTIEARVDGLRFTPADGDRSGQTGHLHFFVDRAPTPADQPIPREDGIIHTTETKVSIPGLAPGEHTVWVVAGDGVHVPLANPVTAKTTFVVQGGP